MKVYQIAPGLWQGGMAHVAENWAYLRDKVDWMVLLADPIVHFPQGPDDPHLIVFPIDDNANGCEESVWKRLRRLARGLSGARTLCVCHMGENRSGLMAALILIHRGHDPESAIQLIRQRVKPNTTQPHVLWNPGFERQIRQIEAP